MDRLNYHSKRAMEEFHAGIEAEDRKASDAHLRLSALHMAYVDELAASPARQDALRPRDARG